MRVEGASSSRNALEAHRHAEIRAAMQALIVPSLGARLWVRLSAATAIASQARNAAVMDAAWTTMMWIAVHTPAQPIIHAAVVVPAFRPVMWCVGRARAGQDTVALGIRAFHRVQSTAEHTALSIATRGNGVHATGSVALAKVKSTVEAFRVRRERRARAMVLSAYRPGTWNAGEEHASRGIFAEMAAV
jgi:hypothetical protein